MDDARRIKKLYDIRWRKLRALADLERQAAAHREAIAQVEAELRTLVLSVPSPVRHRPNPHFAQGEVSRRIRTVLRERGAFLAIDQIVVGIMRAKGMRMADLPLRKDVHIVAQHALRKLWQRGSVAKLGRGKSARWGLPASVAHIAGQLIG